MAVRSKVPIKVGPFFSVEVSLETALERQAGYNNVCVNGHGPTRIKQTPTCPDCGATSGWVKGREVDGVMVVMTKEELDATVDVSSSEAIVVTAHTAEDVRLHTFPGEKSYYLKPGKGYQDGYRLLAQLISELPELAFCTTFSVRGKQAMYELGVYNNTLVLRELAWPGDLKATPEVPLDDRPEEELSMARQIIAGITKDFDPETYKDTQREAREAILRARAEGGEVVELPNVRPAPAGLSLMDQLKAAAEAMSA